MVAVEMLQCVSLQASTTAVKYAVRRDARADPASTRCRQKSVAKPSGVGLARIPDLASVFHGASRACPRSKSLKCCAVIQHDLNNNFNPMSQASGLHLPPNELQYPPSYYENAGHRDLPKDKHRLRIFSGTSNQPLTEEIAAYLGMELGSCKIKRFADGEIYVKINESIRGCDVFLVQPTCPPANDNMMELLVMIDACKRASARTITAVIPYFGYARADRKMSGRESIAAKLMANLITEAGANRVLLLDLHSGQAMGYFDIPVDHVQGQPVILDYLASKLLKSDDVVVVSPDVGGVARARAFAKKLSDAPLAIIDKRRQGHNVAEVMNLIGDVKGKVAVMVDDMIDTAGTIANGAHVLHDNGAREVIACCTHAVFSPPAVERLSSGVFQEVIITNTIPLPPEKYFPQLTILSVGNLLGEAIWRIHDESSVSSIFH
eukprot:jgi/Mesvir1/16836/Mv15729-RA.1